MPRGRSYGDKLRIARERAGIDVVTLAKRLHVRPDILKAIENADFDRMPARGYTRNMIRAYARQVGLNEKEVSEMYLDEVHLYETGTPRLSRSSRDSYARRSESQYSRSSSSRSDRYPESRSIRSRDAYSRDLDATYGRDYSRPVNRQSSAIRTDRSYRDQGRPYSNPTRSRNDDRSIRFASSPSRRLEDDPRYSGAGTPSRSRSVASRDSRSQRDSSIRFSGAPKNGSSSRRRPITLTQSSHSYSDLYSPNNSKSRVPELNMPLMIIIGVVAIAIIIAVVVLFNSTTQSVEDIPDIPIAGYSNTSNPEDQIDPIAALPEPTSAQFTYEVEAGERSYIEIYENGAADPVFSGVVTGPASETYDVTGTLRFEAANPTPVSVTVDGEQVKLTKSPTSGYYTYTVDFTAMLAKWRSENDPNYNSNTTSSNTNTNTNANSSTNSTTNTNRSTSNTSNSSSRSSNTSSG